MTAPLTLSNAQGRTFTCTQTHSPAGYSSIIHAGDTGVIWEAINKLELVKVYRWNERTEQYDQPTASVKHLVLGPLPSVQNLVDYPFRCVRSYTNSSGITVNALEVGSIAQYDASTGKVQVQIPKRQKRIWTRLDHLHIGRTRKFGDIAVETGLPPQLSADPSLADLNNTDQPVTRLLFPLVCSIMNQSSSLGFLPAWLTATVPNRAKALDICRRIAKGVEKAGLSNAYNKDRPWEWKQFVQNGVKITKPSKGQGIYARFYSNFKPKTELFGSDARTYVGKTSKSFGSRSNDHDDATSNPANVSYSLGHYKIARQANKCDSVVLAYLENFSEREIAIAEQAFMLILRAYRPEVISWAPKVAGRETIKTSAEDGNKALSELVADYDAREAATQLTQLAENLWGKLSWGKHLKTSGGCNKASPLQSGSDYEPTLWMMADYPDRRVYYRPPYKVIYSNVDNQVTLFGKVKKNPDGTETSFEIRRRNKEHPVPPKGSAIYFSVEIMKKGRHSHAYTRLPDIGIWSNWDDANQVALRIRWREGKQWYSFYLNQPQDYLGLQDGNEPGSIGCYMDAINIRNHLERKTFQTDLKWFEKWGMARVKQVKFDHLMQTVRVVDPPAASPAVLPTPTRDERAFEAALRNRGITNYGKIKTDKSLNWTTIRAKGAKGVPRTVCDKCHLGSRRAALFPKNYKGPAYWEHKDCIMRGDSRSCVHCGQWGHRCSFTEGHHLYKNVSALFWYPSWPMQAEKVDDPGFETHALED